MPPAAHARLGFNTVVNYTEQDTGGPLLEFQIFDAAYVARLTQGDPDTELHFTSYFGRLLTSKLRVRRIAPQTAEDVRQETFLRVLRTLRQGPGVTQPEAFGAFVSAVCNNVLLETLSKESRHPPIPENAPEPADERVDLDASLITEQRKRVVGRILDSLPAKDREVLRMVFLEEADRAGSFPAFGRERRVPAGPAAPRQDQVRRRIHAHARRLPPHAGVLRVRRGVGTGEKAIPER